MSNEKRIICKGELKYIISNKLNGIKCNRTDMYKIIDEVFDTIVDEMSKGNDIGIRDFGKFTISEIESFYGRNPQDSTEVIKVNGYKRVNFKAGEGFKDKLK